MPCFHPVCSGAEVTQDKGVAGGVGGAQPMAVTESHLSESLASPEVALQASQRS